MTAQAPHVAIVGGGVTGLTAAYRLLMRAEGAPRVTVLEAAPRIGGSLVTVQRDGLVLDGGADAFVAAKPWATDLCRELGIGEHLQETQPESRSVYFLRKGKLVKMPEGLVLAIPTRFWPLVKSPLFSARGIARMALDLVAPPAENGADESIASFLGRRFGSEAVELLGEPLLAGIYSGDPNRLSIHSTFPQLVEIERAHRSLILGALKSRAKVPKLLPPASPTPRPPSAFLALRSGMGELVSALSARVDELGADTRLSTDVARIDRDNGRFKIFTKRKDKLETLHADKVLFACAAPSMARALESFDPELGRELRGIPYASTAAVLLAYERSAVRHPLDASGVLIPRSEGREASAITFMSSKWANRAPSDVALFRVFLGGHARPEVRTMTNVDLVHIAREELQAVLGIHAEPQSVEVFRWNDSRPQPVLGHRDRIKRIRQRLSSHGQLYAAGAAFDGVGIPDCVRQANEVAKLL